ncbi:hypothetical protein GBA52_020360 [Prunus armeniaca]|nr:hypothetical protein GBA52_020360 [Prunus armeniaca]
MHEDKFVIYGVKEIVTNSRGCLLKPNPRLEEEGWKPGSMMKVCGLRLYPKGLLSSSNQNSTVETPESLIKTIGDTCWSKRTVAYTVSPTMSATDKTMFLS